MGVWLIPKHQKCFKPHALYLDPRTNNSDLPQENKSPSKKAYLSKAKGQRYNKLIRSSPLPGQDGCFQPQKTTRLVAFEIYHPTGLSPVVVVAGLYSLDKNAQKADVKETGCFSMSGCSLSSSILSSETS